MRMSRVLSYDDDKLIVVQQVDGKDRTTGREWHSIKAEFGRLEKKFKMDLASENVVEWQTTGYRFEAMSEGLLVTSFDPPPL